MVRIPTTSETLLRDISGDMSHPRWAEFAARYRPMMQDFVARRFPGLEADDLIQQTLADLALALPGYRYRPGEDRHFHCYLSGILRHKCIDALQRETRRRELVRQHLERRLDAGELVPARESPGGDGAPGDWLWATAPEPPGTSREEWLREICAIAVRQLEAETVERNPRQWQVFRRTWIDGESPAAVAESLMLTRAAVDQTKKRMLGRLEEVVRRLKEIERV
jgi:RNA polymerase sigma factor (sigma-70 family)